LIYNDRKDNNRTITKGLPGPADPAGPHGLQGIQGIQGLMSPHGTEGKPSPVGPGVLNDTRFYLASGPLDGTSPFGSNAVCDEGDSATGKGYTTAGDVDITFSSPANGRNGWTI
jgi:hypothetical protein